MNLKLIYQLYCNMGSRYFLYRIKHEVEKKSGKLLRKHPKNLQLKTKISIDKWISLNDSFKFYNSDLVRNSSLEELYKKAQRILSGKIQFFNAEWIDLGQKYDWITNPSNKFKYDINKHWSVIPDLSLEAGDIKYVWEKSRFSWVNTLIRYDFHFNQDSSEFIFSEIESWIDHNPINMGPNWRCSQEISLRIFNWFNVLNYYRKNVAFTDERWKKIQDVIYASLHHVYNHIDFSRIAVRNNHAITETLFLSLSNIMFPFIEETKAWSKDGRKWFEEEVNYQIYDDGTFLQFSHNYHRVVIQLLTLGISITEKANLPFSEIVYIKAYKSMTFLYQCLQEENGWLPNYGSNDGALFFPFSDSNYRDFRPQLNSLCYLLTGNLIYNDLKFSEEIYWWGLKPSKFSHFDKPEKFFGIKKYSDGGYIIIRDQVTFTFIRCGSHRDRPAQADNLHVDIWFKGTNIFRDSGTYKYNTSQDLVNYFTGTRSHNTVSVNGESQMLKGNRFIWFYWTQEISSKIWEDDQAYYFEGEISTFLHLHRNGQHLRRIKKYKNSNKWVVYDEIRNLDDFMKEQIWHYCELPYLIIAKENGRKLKSEKTMSLNSNYYGVKETGNGLSFKFKNSIETEIEII